MRTACINPTNINQARLKAGMTQADVAYRLREQGHKANERSIRRWESGQHAPHANVVPALANALGVTIDALYVREGAEDDEEDEAALRRFAHLAIDHGNHALAIELLEQAVRVGARGGAKVKVPA